MPDSLQDRLRLDPKRIDAMARALLEVAALPDPVGEVVRGSTPPTAWRSARSASRWA